MPYWTDPMNILSMTLSLCHRRHRHLHRHRHRGRHWLKSCGCSRIAGVFFAMVQNMKYRFKVYCRYCKKTAVKPKPSMNGNILTDDQWRDLHQSLIQHRQSVGCCKDLERHPDDKDIICVRSDGYDVDWEGDGSDYSKADFPRTHRSRSRTPRMKLFALRDRDQKRRWGKDIERWLATAALR